MVFTPLETSTDKKEEVINDNFSRIAAKSIFGVIDRTLTAPPVTPNTEGVYIPQSPATGAWENKENTLAWWSGNGYLFMPPKEGMMLGSQQDATILKYSSGQWQVTVQANAVFSTVTASRDIVQADKGFILDCDSENPINLTLVSGNVSPGFNCTIRRKNTGEVNLVVPAGSTLEAIGTSITEQYTAVYLAYKDSGLWVAFGALS